MLMRCKARGAQHAYLSRIAGAVRGPALRLKGNEKGRPGSLPGQLNEDGAILPDAVFTRVIVQGIALVHLDFVDAVDYTPVLKRTAEGVKQ